MPEIILLSTFCVALFVLASIYKEYKFALAARIAMSAMCITTAIAHFVFTKGMSMMLPDFIPYRTGLIYFTGIVEAMAAIGLLITKYKKLTGLLLITFFVLILPSNIYAALHHVNLEKATFDGNGPVYLWFRIPLQLFFIACVYFSCIHPVPDKKIKGK